jgi:hypothetical protein
MTREKDKHYLEIISSFRFSPVIYTLETQKRLTPHTMGNLNELFILDNINTLQKHGLVPRELLTTETYEFENDVLKIENFKFFFNKENEFFMMVMNDLNEKNLPKTFVLSLK